MNVEQNRLLTFQSWPDNAPVEPALLAREGFFATHNFLETECHWCHNRISDWQYGDNITTRHTFLEPTCVFVTSPTNCGNVPASSSISESTTVQQQQQQQSSNNFPSTSISIPMDLSRQHMNLKIEANRLATFVNWPNPNITPKSLAKAGFFYLNRSDAVQCAWCKGIIGEWQKQDNAFDEHQRLFPNCPRAQLGPLVELASDGMRDLGIQQISLPKRPEFASIDARLRTYSNWPISDIQDPRALAQAGLFYRKIDDQVRCFHCYIGLRSWEKEDDPWFEHAKWYPQCQFVRLVKGLKFVEHVQEVTRQSGQQVNSCEDATSVRCSSVSIDEAMSSPAVLQALEIGIDVGSVRTATQRRLQLTGRPYDTVEDLLKAVFGDDDDDGDDDDGLRNNHSEDNQGANALYSLDDSTNNTATTSNGVGSSVVATEPSCVSPTHRPSDQGIDVPPVERSSDIASTSSDNTQSNSVSADTSPEAFSPPNDNTQAIPDRSIALEVENRNLKDARLCKVCLDEEVGVVFLPCGHLVICVQCAPSVRQCPMCRTAIKGFVRTFLS